MSKEIAEEYASSLADLTVNSKPLINMLTILAEENVEHAGVIVETVEKHLEKVHPEIKLPVLYLVDSIIKNVGGAYSQKFSQSIVNMFTRTFKLVDEKVRSQMFKLRETWHDVFPATKLYQLDVKVSLIDPAWPIQAQPQQLNIHVNPNFLKKNPTTSVAPTPPTKEEDEKMRSILAKKEQELLMLQRKKIEMELEQTKRQLEMAEKNAKRVTVPPGVPTPGGGAPVAPVAPVPALVLPDPANSVKNRLGPPVNKTGGRIAPVSGALAAARRDPRLARHAASTPAPTPAPTPPVAIAPNVFDIKPLNKRKNVITIDVRPEAAPARRRDPRLDKRRERDRDRTRKLDDAARALVDKLAPSADPRRIMSLPPIPKIVRDEPAPAPAPATSLAKRRKEGKEGGRERRRDKRPRERRRAEPEPEPEPAPVAFKELRNYHKERYMRRNREKSASPEEGPAPAPLPAPEPEPQPEPPNLPDVSETKDVDLRVLPVVAEAKAAAVGQKRSSTEALEGKAKKNKHDKFDILFGNEDVDLRQLPQVDETSAPPPPSITGSPKSDDKPEDIETVVKSPQNSPKQKDWNEVKDTKNRGDKKTPSKLDLVRAKLAEATKGKDVLGRPRLFSKSPSVEKERRRTLSSEDMDLRAENPEDFDAGDHKKTISIIMNQAKEQYTDGKLDKSQYNTLMYQVLQLNEKLKLKEAKQRESLEISKRKLKAHIQEENHKVVSPKSSPNDRNNYGDIDERVTPSVFVDTPPDSQAFMQDSDMRMNNIGPKNGDGMKINGPPLMPPMMPPMYAPYQPMWRGPRPRIDEYVPRRFRGPNPPFFRGKFDNRPHRPPLLPSFEPRLPTPKLGMCQGESPLQPYVRSESPPPIGAPGFAIPPTDFKILEYIDHDPVKTIQIDGVPREIRFYGETAVIMLDWDDPREIKFLPGCRRVTFDNKDSVVLSFNEGYKQVEIDDQQFEIRFGAPTRELYINGRWYECFFGGQPLGVIIDGKPRLVHLEGPLPQVDIGKTKRTDLVAGKINLIVNATQMSPVYLDAKVQKFNINGQFFTIRFVDSLRTVLINEQPFKVEFGDLPKPIFIGNEKFFVRFSALPRNVKPGVTKIAYMEGLGIPAVVKPVNNVEEATDNAMEVDQEPIQRPIKTPSPDMSQESQGLDMLASVMPSSMEPASASCSEYSVADPLFNRTDKIPGLETPSDEKPANSTLPLLGNINVTDLFAKLVATGIVQVPVNPVQSEKKEEPKVEDALKMREDKTAIHRVDLQRIESLRVRQPGVVSRLYGGMQCSGCGARFPPEQTVRYSQHLDWHFRQNRRERESARRPHSRHWHYDLPDWLQYEELEDLEEREKSWFETGGAEGEGEGPSEVLVETPSVAAGAPADHFCALCGDKFDQFYNEDKEEWHLRNSVRHEEDDKNYHPMCYEDYKASLTKEEPEPEVVEETKPVEVEEAIEIKDVDEEVNEPSDDESDVELVDPEVKDPVEPVQILVYDGEDEGSDDEDDVVLKAEPVEQVDVRDDDDTDDETTAARAQRDLQADIDFANVRVKQEPIDPDDEPIITAEEESMLTTFDTTHTTVLSSIDGNVQLDAASQPATMPPGGGIRINITKTIPSFITNNHDDKMLEDISADDEPLPPGEEPELEYNLKPALESVQFSRQPPVQRGNELSGLCSIM